MEDIKILTAGDSSLLVQMTQEIRPDINGKLSALVKLIKEQKVEGVIDTIPAFCSLLINYNPRVVSYGELKKRIESMIKVDVTLGEHHKKVFEIPVCYGGEYGPDLSTIAKHGGISEKKVIEIHSGKDYLIYMLGFLPGFTYLGGLDERIHTPRLPNPRLRIPAGSVGIGGSQTGIYPMDSPGGWQLMGKTPIKTYDPGRAKPILMEAGDYIRFVPIEEKEFLEIQKLVEAGTYQCKVRKGGE